MCYKARGDRLTALREVGKTVDWMRELLDASISIKNEHQIAQVGSEETAIYHDKWFIQIQWEFWLF